MQHLQRRFILIINNRPLVLMCKFLMSEQVAGQDKLCIADIDHLSSLRLLPYLWTYEKAFCGKKGLCV